MLRMGMVRRRLLHFFADDAGNLPVSIGTGRVNGRVLWHFSGAVLTTARTAGKSRPFIFFAEG
jgi:hypothetical protein